LGAEEALESGGEIAALKEGFDGFDREWAKRAVGLAVFGFVIAEEVVPGMVDDLPERRDAGSSRTVDRGR
jgi:hypothetical protein